jgi:eukaryotic-like serine/threonine-protein kinase
VTTQGKSESQFTAVAALCCLIVLVFSGAVCVGWMFDIMQLKKVLPDQPVVQSSTAFGIFLASLGLGLQILGGRKLWVSIATKLLAAVLLIGGMATLVENVSQSDWGLDFNLWNPATDSRGLTFPGPMAPNVSADLILLSLALFVPFFAIKKKWVLSQIAAFGVGLLSAMALIGHACGVEFLCTVFGCIKMPLIGAVVFLLLSLAYVFYKPDRGVTAIFVADSIGGKLARRLSALMVAIPVLLWLRALGHDVGWYDEAFGWAIFGVATIASVGICIGWNASTLDGVNAAKEEAERKAADASSMLEEMYNSNLMSQSGTVKTRARVKHVCLHCMSEYGTDVSVCPEDGTALTQLADESIVGTMFADKYHVISLLGSGGMSSVYKSKHVLMNRIVALKVLQSHLASSPQSVKRFQQEAQAASKLKHPNLVSVFDFGVSSVGEPYLVMDYLQGKSLADLLDKVNRLDTDRLISIFAPVCDAMAHAHAEGVIHRDLKPGNIMLVDAEDGSEVPKVVDFGLAKFIDDGSAANQKLTQTGEIFGSPLYMSPEQCLGQKLDARTDVYGLGCVMYECLTGSPPLRGATIVETINLQLDAMPKPFSSDLKIPVKLEQLVFKALAKEPSERQQNATQLKQEIMAVKKPSHSAQPR